MRKLIPIFIASSLALGACGGDDEKETTSSSAGKPATAEGSASTVEIKAFQFKPKPIEVKAGTTVTFLNQDATDHDVTSGPRDKPDKKFPTGKLGPSGGKAEIAFDKPGTYEYYCSLHPGEGLEGTVEVQ